MANMDRRGDFRTATGRNPATEAKERTRRGGSGSYDAGPGSTGMPSASEMDRPPMPCGTFGRTGSSRGGIATGIRKIQDADRGSY